MMVSTTLLGTNKKTLQAGTFESRMFLFLRLDMYPFPQGYLSTKFAKLKPLVYISLGSCFPSNPSLHILTG